MRKVILSIILLVVNVVIHGVATGQNPMVPPAVQTPPSLPSIPADPTVRIGKLPNGITYYIKVNHKPENRAELRMAVKAGSMQEDPDQLGIAHFVEHMAFNGSEHFSKNELVNYLESIGTRFGPDLNAYTSFDETVYMLQVRTDEPDHLEKGLLILHDWANGIAFENEEIDKERGVVISEWRTRLSAEQRMSQISMPITYYRSRYAERLPIGDPEILKTVSYDAVRRFYKDWYRPDLLSIFVVGEINPDSIEQKIKDQFGNIPVSEIRRKKEDASVPPHDQTFVRVITDPEASFGRVEVIHKHKYHPVTDLLDYRQQLVHNLYNRMLGKRLAEIGRRSDPPFVFGYSGYGQDVGDLGTYTSTAIADPKNIRRAYRTLLEENRRVVLHGFTGTELDREKKAMIRSMEQNALEKDKQESSRIVQRLVYHFLESTPIPDPDQTLEMYNSMMPTITLSEINELAGKWISDKSRVILILGPQKDISLLPDSIELMQMLNEIGMAELPPYEDIDVSAPLLSGGFPSQPFHEQYDSTMNIYTWEFDNGVRVIAKPTNFRNDEILMNAYSPGGHSVYSDELYPSARSASTVVGSSGVGPFNATGLDKKLTGLRVSVSPFIFERYEGFNGSSSVKDLETMMQLIYSYGTTFREDTVALNAFISREKAIFSNVLANPNNWYSEQITKITSQNHPRRGFPPMESYDRISMQDIMKIYADRFKDFSDMDFFFVGSFQPDSLRLLASRYLGALPSAHRTENWKDIGERMPSGRIDTVFNRGEAPRSMVQLIYHGEDRFDTDSGYVLQSLIELARIKLRESLREDEGGVYGVSVYGGQSKFPVEQYSIRVSFNADPPATQKLMEAARVVISGLKEKIDDADIAKVKELQRQTRVRELEQNHFWMNAFINTWMNNTDIGQHVQLEALEKQMESLTGDSLLQAARKYFNEAEVITAVMYPDKT